MDRSEVVKAKKFEGCSDPRFTHYVRYRDIKRTCFKSCKYSIIPEHIDNVRQYDINNQGHIVRSELLHTS